MEWWRDRGEWGDIRTHLKEEDFKLGKYYYIEFTCDCPKLDGVYKVNKEYRYFSNSGYQKVLNCTTDKDISLTLNMWIMDIKNIKKLSKEEVVFELI